MPTSMAARRGSSPRGRGALDRDDPGVALEGLIPARAGSTRQPNRGDTSGRAHPRAGGEHLEDGVLSLLGEGSSPRGRGAPPPEQPTTAGRGLIPARAGSTQAYSPPLRQYRAHPRAGGEHPLVVSAVQLRQGSSPRGRGARPVSGLKMMSGGLIPARAGSTPGKGPLRRTRRAHPRAGGEHTLDVSEARRRGGSSPRGRGARAAWTVGDVHGGLIPARAGSTRPSPPTRPWTRAHPRAGGEHTSGPLLVPLHMGSSPRGRGAHLLTWEYIGRSGCATLHSSASHFAHAPDAAPSGPKDRER